MEYNLIQNFVNKFENVPKFQAEGKNEFNLLYFRTFEKACIFPYRL